MADNYFVFGEEEYLVTAKVNELCSRHSTDSSWEVERIGNWEDGQGKLATMAMFAQRRIFILELDELIRAKPEPTHVETALAGHSNVLIVYCKSKPDKRTRIFKVLKEWAKNIELTAPKGSELQQWVSNKAFELGAKEIDPRGAAELIYLAGSNMLLLENELNKLISYDPKISVENVRKFAVRDLQASIFDLVDSVAEGNTAKALNIVEELVTAGAGIPYVLQMLARQYRLLFRMLFYRQQGFGSPEVQKIIQLHPFAFKKMWQQASGLSAKQCANALQRIAEADYQYKTGQSQGIGMLQMLAVNLAKK
jgi:DNA polymerase-3 subunit delta